MKRQPMREIIDSIEAAFAARDKCERIATMSDCPIPRSEQLRDEYVDLRLEAGWLRARLRKLTAEMDAKLVALIAAEDAEQLSKARDAKFAAGDNPMCEAERPDDEQDTPP